ncbi:MAG TPA: YkvA family protein [Dehalococcoidia bacterium]
MAGGGEARQGDGSSLARRIWRLPFRGKLRLAGALLRDPRVPRTAKAAVPLTVLYLAVPVDLVPDFIPVLGQLDDVLVAAGALWLLRRLASPELMEEHVARLEQQTAAHGGYTG